MKLSKLLVLNILFLILLFGCAAEVDQIQATETVTPIFGDIHDSYSAFTKKYESCHYFVSSWYCFFIDDDAFVSITFFDGRDHDHTGFAISYNEDDINNIDTFFELINFVNGHINYADMQSYVDSWLMSGIIDEAIDNPGNEYSALFENLMVTINYNTYSGFELSILQYKEKPIFDPTPKPTITQTHSPYAPQVLGNLKYSLPPGNNWCWEDYILSPDVMSYYLDSNCNRSDNPNLMFIFYLIDDVSFVTNEKSIEYFITTYLEDEYNERIGKRYTVYSSKIISNIEYDHIGFVTLANVFLYDRARESLGDFYISTFEYKDDIYYVASMYFWEEPSNEDETPMVDGYYLSEINSYIDKTFKQLFTYVEAN
jgi:hypothetical protein